MPMLIKIKKYCSLVIIIISFLSMITLSVITYSGLHCSSDIIIIWLMLSDWIWTKVITSISFGCIMIYKSWIPFFAQEDNLYDDGVFLFFIPRSEIKLSHLTNSATTINLLLLLTLKLVCDMFSLELVGPVTKIKNIKTDSTKILRPTHFSGLKDIKTDRLFLGLILWIFFLNPISRS